MQKSFENLSEYNVMSKTWSGRYGTIKKKTFCSYSLLEHVEQQLLVKSAKPSRSCRVAKSCWNSSLESAETGQGCESGGVQLNGIQLWQNLPSLAPVIFECLFPCISSLGRWKSLAFCETIPLGFSMWERRQASAKPNYYNLPLNWTWCQGVRNES